MNNTDRPDIPSDIRVYFFVLAIATIMFAVFWLVFRFV